MTIPTFRLFCYLTFVIISGIAKFFRMGIIKTNVIIKLQGNWEYLFLFGTIVYCVFMLINSILQSRAKTELEIQKQIKTSFFLEMLLLSFFFINWNYIYCTNSWSF